MRLKPTKTLSDIKCLNDLKNQNFSVLWLKWTQTMEIKENQTFFHETYSNLLTYLFYQKISKYFNDFQNRNFSVLRLKWTQTIEMQKNQTFFHGTYSNLTPYIFYQNIFFHWTYSNLTLFSFCRKILNHYYWYFSFLLQKWAYTGKLK